MKAQCAACYVFFTSFYTALVISVLFILPARANDLPGGVGIGTTRVIYHEGDSSASLKIFNTGSTPWLTQVRVTDASGNNSKSLTVLPPLFRLEGNSENSVRIRMTGAPGERSGQDEAIWYVRVLSVPPLSQPAETLLGGAIGVSLESIIKLFWRPASLPEPGEKVFRDVVFKHVPDGITACNPGHYYLSFNQLRVDGQALDLNAVPSMLAPGQCERYKVKGERVSWSMINDSGGDSGEFSATVSG